MSAFTAPASTEHTELSVLSTTNDTALPASEDTALPASEDTEQSSSHDQESLRMDIIEDQLITVSSEAGEFILTLI